MPLSGPEREHAEKWIHSKCPTLRCPACSATVLEVIDLAGIPAAPPRPDGASTQVIPVVCTRCGYLLLFSAGVMGLV